MATAAIERLYKITVDGTQAVNSLKKIEKSTGELNNKFNGLGRAARSALGVIAGAFSVSFASGTLAEFEDLRTSLESVTGSAEEGRQAFDGLSSLVQQTPFQIKDLASAFITLKAAGITPTQQQMMLFSDTASITTDKLGTLQAMVDLFARTTAGGLGLEDLNRLGDRGVPALDILNEKLGISRMEISEVGKTADGARKILDALSEGLQERFGGSSLRAVNNLSTSVSNLGGEFDIFIDKVFNSTGALDLMKAGIEGFTSFIKTAGTGISAFVTDLKNLETGATAFAAVLGGALVKVAFPAFLAGMKAIKVALLTNPFTALAVAAAAAATFIITNWNNVGAYINNIWVSLQEQAAKLPVWFNSVFKEIGLFAELWSLQTEKLIRETFAAPIEWVLVQMNKLVAQFNDLNPFENLAIEPIDVEGFIDLSQFDDKIMDIQGSLSELQKETDEKLNKIGDKFKGLYKPIKDVETALGGVAGGIGETGNGVDELEAKMTALAKTYKNLGDTPMDKLKKQFDEIVSLIDYLQANPTAKIGINVEEATKALGKVVSDMEKLKVTADEVSETLQETVIQSFVDSMGTVAGEIVNFAKTGQESFKDMAESILSDIARIALQMQLTNSLKGYFEFADGGAFRSSTGLPYGIYDKPTHFNLPGGGPIKTFAKGGILGEAGPEAILPLKTGSDGKLGVGGGATTVNVINNSGGTATVSEQETANGGKEITVLIESAMETAVANGRMDKVLGANFGLRRQGY